MQKVLIFLSLLLLVVVLGEVYYLFIYKATKNNSVPTATVTSETRKISPNIVSPSVTAKAQNDIDGFISSNKHFQEQGVLLESRGTYVYKYTIDEVNYLKPSDTAKTAIAATILFTTADGKQHTVNLNNNDLEKTRVYDDKDGVKRIISFTELKKGDIISYQSIINFFVEPGLGTENITITRLNNES